MRLFRDDSHLNVLIQYVESVVGSYEKNLPRKDSKILVEKKSHWSRSSNNNKNNATANPAENQSNATTDTIISASSEIQCM